MGPKREERTAYHEAGHAVAAFRMRKKFKYVTIDPTEESLGHIIIHKFSDSFDPELDERSRIRHTIEKSIIIDFAGNVAESKFLSKEVTEGWESDFSDAADLAIYFCSSAEETEAYLNWLFIRTKNLISEPLNWNAVKTLAEKLLEKRRIGYMLARKIIYKSFQDAFNRWKNTREKTKD